MPEHTIDDPNCGCWGCIQLWELRNSAVSSLKLLCEERLRVDLVGYGESPPVEMSLIDQLASAAFERGVEVKAAGGPRGSGVPVDLVASEMFSTLTDELHDDAVMAAGVSAYADGDATADARALVSAVGGISEVEWLQRRADNWARWCRRIREHLAPSRRTPIPGVCPNPECCSSEWFTYDDEGGRIRDHALRAVWVGEEVDGVECVCCFSFWPRRSLWELASSLDPNLVLRLRSGCV